MFSGMEDNFDKHAFTRNLVVYDYGSVMHYSQHAFSKQPYLPSIEVNLGLNCFDLSLETNSLFYFWI